MSLVTEVLGYLIFDVFLASTGALIYWTKDGFKKPLKDYIQPEYDRVYVVGLVFWISIGALCALFAYYSK